MFSAAFASALLASALFGIAAGQQTPEAASGVLLTPIRLFLDSGEPIGDVTVRNGTNDTMRFQVNGFAWQESVEGKTELHPSNDLIFYPTIFMLAPGASQVMRIGVEGAASRTERTFRLIITALPPPILPGQLRTTQIEINERFSIPIFLQPSNPVSRVEALRADVTGTKLSIELRNAGTSYDLVHSIAVTGLTASGSALFTVKAAGWYLLSGGERVFTFAIPRNACAEIHSVKIVANKEKGSLDTTLPVQGGCQ